MHKTRDLKPVSAAVGAAFAGTMLLGGAVNAAENPFGLAELGSGYMQVASNHMEGKCGGAKSTAEGNCGGAKPAAEGKCGGAKPAAEGKCGEGKCGSAK
jgi:uncharacterized low-complexity protein